MCTKDKQLCDDYFINLDRGCDIIDYDDSTFEELIELVKTNACASAWFLD